MPELIGPHDRVLDAAFAPKLGDLVEFDSDRQTEKGPSGGSVIAVDRDAQTATIRHSDHPGETFVCGKVAVRYFRLREDGKPFWMLA